MNRRESLQSNMTKLCLIQVGGRFVSPLVLEDLILQLPGVEDAAVFGLPDSEFGARPCAAVVRKTASEEAASAAGIVAHVDSKVEDYQRLRGGVVFVDQGGGEGGSERTSSNLP